MRVIPSLLAAVTALTLAGCATTPRTASRPAVTPAVATAETATPQDCVELTRIREAKVRDGQTIDFILRGGSVLRNRLPYSCPNLGFEQAFSYSTSLSRLCSTDIITVIQQGGGPTRGASCGLGKFVPHTPIPAAADTAG